MIIDSMRIKVISQFLKQSKGLCVFRYMTYSFFFFIILCRSHFSYRWHGLSMFNVIFNNNNKSNNAAISYIGVAACITWIYPLDISLTNFVTCSCIEYTSPWIEIKKLVMMRTGCIGACKSTKKDTVATFRW